MGEMVNADHELSNSRVEEIRKRSEVVTGEVDWMIEELKSSKKRFETVTNKEGRSHLDLIKKSPNIPESRPDSRNTGRKKIPNSRFKS